MLGQSELSRTTMPCGGDLWLSLVGGIRAVASRLRRAPRATAGRPYASGSRFWLAVLLGLLLPLLLPVPCAFALQPIVIGPEQDRIDLTNLSERYEGRGDRLQVDTAPGPDGIAGRVEVKAVTSGTNPSWIVFALRNPTQKPIERWVVAERFTLVGSGVMAPDLDAARLAALTPSQGFVPDRIQSDRADIYQVTLEAGQTVTFVAELASERFPQVTLWQPRIYETKLRERTLFNGIMLGITGILAVFLTAIFAANHKIIFPVTGLVAWSTLALLCVEFGFWHRIFRLSPEDNALYRATAEAAVAGSLVLFLFVFLDLGRWLSWIRAVFLLWLAAQGAILVGALLDPVLAATFARASFALIAILGSLLILSQMLTNADRALALLPSWLLLLVWIFGAAVAVLGRLHGDFVASSLVAGLVLILLLMAFTVTQYAFATHDVAALRTADPGPSRNLAIDGAGAAVWEWSSRRDEIQVSAIVEDVLGLQRGELSCRVDDWIKHLRLSDRERLRMKLLTVQEKNGGHVNVDFQMRGSDGNYRWFELRASSLPQVDQRTLKCVGLLREVTRERRAQERLVLDAVRDNLTGLPNRAILLDRMAVRFQAARAGTPPAVSTLLLIEIERLERISDELGPIRADSLLLNIAKRLGRNLSPKDTLARIGPDNFAILLVDGSSARDVAVLAERVRQGVRTPMKFSGKEIVLTARIGVATMEDDQSDHLQWLRDADTALLRAQRAGSDRIEIFNTGMRSDADNRTADAADLKRAMERGQISAHYLPIHRLGTEEPIGFESIVRWDHPKHGAFGPADMIPIADQGGFAPELLQHILRLLARDATQWQKQVQRDGTPLFVSVNLGSALILQPGFIQDLRSLLGRQSFPKGTLRIEVSEQLIAENPERAVEFIDWFRMAEAAVTIEGFGLGHFPLGYLGRVAADTIKLDRTLAYEAMAGGNGALLVKGLVALAHELGRSVLVDGIETSADVDALIEAGCDAGLGAYYGEPLTAKQVDELATQVRKSERRSSRRGSLIGGLVARPGGQERAQEGKERKTARSGGGLRSRPRSLRLQPSALADGEAAMPSDVVPATARAAAPAPAPEADLAYDYPDAVLDALTQDAPSMPAMPAAPSRQAAAAHASAAVVDEGSAYASMQLAPWPSEAELAMPPPHVAPPTPPAAPPSPPPAAPSEVALTTRIVRSLSPGGGRPVEQADEGGGLARLQRRIANVTGAISEEIDATPRPPAAPTADKPKAAESGFAFQLPDSDILRGMAMRLQAALRQGGKS